MIERTGEHIARYRVVYTDWFKGTCYYECLTLRGARRKDRRMQRRLEKVREFNMLPEQDR